MAKLRFKEKKINKDEVKESDLLRIDDDMWFFR